MSDKLKKKIEVLEMIAQDMADDATKFDGQPFNGRTVAEYFGNQGAAIAALANIIKSELEAAQLQLERTCAECGHLWESHNQLGCCWNDDCQCKRPRPSTS